MGNFTLFIFGIYSLYRFVLEQLISAFQTNLWPRVQTNYKKLLSWCLQTWRPALVVGIVIFLFFFSIVFTAIRKPPVVFFPKGDPNFIFAYISMPIGTDQRVTDSITHIVEERVNTVVGTPNPVVKSVIVNVAKGASENPFEGGAQSSPHLGKVTVAFLPFAQRSGKSTSVYLDKIREAVKGIKGGNVAVDQEQGGPPTGKPISIEISSENFSALVAASTSAKKYLDSLQIPGVEELKSDFPLASDEELRRRFIARVLPREDVITAYKFDPLAEGYEMFQQPL
jgi:multidrug efflux pump subunit AcrB